MRLATCFAVVALGAGAATQYVGDDGGDWASDANWSEGVPGDGADVLIDGHSPVLAVSTHALKSVVVTNATLTFTNWAATLSAETVTVRNGGTITHAPCDIRFDTGNTNRVRIVCTDLTLDPGGKIDVNGRGFGGTYPPQPSGHYYGQGPGRGYSNNGGGHGGFGAVDGYKTSTNDVGLVYGSASTPVHPGSGGGGANTSLGSPGGGAVRIEATGAVVIDGAITADGGNYNSQGGAGSGGSVWITCSNLAGSAAGIVAARGGNGDNNKYNGHAGGGGRIAVHYQGFDRFHGTRSAACGTEGPTMPAYRVAQDGTVVCLYFGTDPLFSVTGSPAGYGSPAPHVYEPWARPYPAGTVITNEVQQAVPVDAGLRRWCVGWTAAASGAVFAGGTATQAVFVLPAADTVQTWLWTNQWFLTVATGLGGTASESASGWHTNAVPVVLEAEPAEGYAFAQWSGDVPFGDRLKNPVTVTMDRARAIEASFVDLVTRPRVWRGTGYWWESANWEPEGLPNAESPVTIAAGTVTVETPFSAGGLVISNGATLRTERWDSAVTVGGDVDVFGTITSVLSDADPVTRVIAVTNRIVIVCTNLTVHAGGAINADTNGFRGALTHPTIAPQWGFGPGAGYQSTGGSYGGFGSIHGYGSDGYVGPTYGTAEDPGLPGSSGGGNNGKFGKPGGGLVRIAAGGTVTVNGAITADGGDYTVASSGGSGGGIYIRCLVFAADNGRINADGGCTGPGQWDGGGGGGGRIAIHYDPAAQAAANLVKMPVVRLSARSWWGRYKRGTPGTIWLTDGGFFPGNATALHGGEVLFGNPSDYACTTATLVCSNDFVSLPAGCAVNIGGDLTVSNDSGLLLRGPLTVGGSATFDANIQGLPSQVYATNGSGVAIAGDLTVRGLPLAFYSGGADRMHVSVGGSCHITNGSNARLTSGIAPGYPLQPGAELIVGHDLMIASNATLFLESHPTNGGSPHISARSVMVGAGGRIDADATGFGGGPGPTNSWGYGPGRSFKSCGGCHGGLGGIGYVDGAVGVVYGAPEAPLEPGSGGGSYASYVGGRGGGLVRLAAAGTVTVDGAVSANGQSLTTHAGAGAGGAIYITCGVLAGGGSLSAAGGGNSTSSLHAGGSGGGGRIAVAVTGSRRRYTGTALAAGGVGYNATRVGAEGTVVWIDPPVGTVLLLR